MPGVHSLLFLLHIRELENSRSLAARNRTEAVAKLDRSPGGTVETFAIAALVVKDAGRIPVQG
jgi:hypothetical protein